MRSSSLDSRLRRSEAFGKFLWLPLATVGRQSWKDEAEGGSGSTREARGGRLLVIFSFTHVDEEQLAFQICTCLNVRLDELLRN